MSPNPYDVVIVGAANAAFCAAHIVRENVGQFCMLGAVFGDRAGNGAARYSRERQ